MPVGHLCAFFGKLSIEAYAQFLVRLFGVFFMFSCMNHLYIVVINPLPVIYMQVFSPI